MTTQSRLTAIYCALAFSLIHSLPVSACTIFVLTDGNRVLFCNNEDYSDPKTRVWFVAPGDGRFGCALVGLDDGWAQGGVNSEGLAFDWVAGYTAKWDPDPMLPKAPGNSSQRALETCTTIDEVIAFYRTHRESSFRYGQVMFADKTGASVIIGAKDNQLQVEKLNQCRGFGYGQQVLKKMLEPAPEPTVANAASILRAAQQKGEYGTKYSNIFDLKSGDIFLYPSPDQDNAVKLNLGDELKKGSHFYDIPQIQQELEQPPKPLHDNMKPPARAGAPPKLDHPTMQDFDAQAMRGDVKAGLAILDRVPVNALSTDDQQRRAAILVRFQDRQVPPIEIDAPLTRDIASVYQTYWSQCLLQKVELSAANAELFSQLKACLGKHGKEPERFSSLNDLTEALGPMLLAEGFHSIRGVTAPYYELMLWKGETTNHYDVELPESTQKVTVVLMSKFVLQGWLGFATLDKQHTSGWSTKDSLYCLRESYDLESEQFRVSYLAHEAQHFADARQFPKLEQPEQEYRAKLVELSRADHSLYELLEAFTRQSGADRKWPHPFADLRVVQHLSNALFGDESAVKNPARWHEKDRQQIHEAALNLLRASTKTLQGLRR